VSQRTERLDSQIRTELMDILQRDMADPRLGFATVTRIDTAPDLTSARVWVSVYGADADPDQTMAALADAAGWLRHRLAERMHIRRVPRLEFRHDESIAGGDRVLRLIREVEESEGA
jgi:ribosome-binding factor A